MSDTVISVRDLGKQYFIGRAREKYSTLRDTVADGLTAPIRRVKSLVGGNAAGAAELTESMWALRDVSFDVHHGDVVGIVGANGAGKSTLLKILSKITEPTTGRARIRGRVGSLLEVGTGFHPELTGRENIYLNGAILGMGRAEINRKFDEIVAFAETEKFLDTPVKHYSSGMSVRLAFAVAAHLEPEVLVIDEVLAVGDVAFQKKCLGKMGDVAQAGRTVLFVSHNMAAVSALCSRGILLDRGRLVHEGSVPSVISQYLGSLDGLSTAPLADRQDRDGDGQLRFTNIAFLDERRNPVSAAASGQPLVVRLDYATGDDRPARNVDMDVAFYGALGQLLFVCKVNLAHRNFETLSPSGQIECFIPNFPLNPGRYQIKLWCEVNRTRADRVHNAATLMVEGGDFYGTGNLPRLNPEGIVMVNHTWTVLPETRPARSGAAV